MDINIVRIQPSPFMAHSGGTGPVVVTIGVAKATADGNLQFENRQPAGAEISADGRTGDIVTVPLGALPVGITHTTVMFGVDLQTATQVSGAIIGVDARVVDSSDTPLSPDFPFLTVIAAAAAR
jgi:carbon monoxide dehydrogenase subunit G